MSQLSKSGRLGFNSLSAWLTHLESLHPKDIELGLDRVKLVFNQLNLDFSASKIVLLAGTNGKGTSCHLLQQILTQHGYQVGCYNSPHIHDYRERVTLDNKWFSEQQHCDVFAQIEAARGDTPLTYFEFGTLAAITMLAQAKPDFILLEVGLGGRLDATNIVEPDLSIITTIDIDHKDWLGDTRELIAKEKAGICRPHGKTICGDFHPPVSLQQIAQSLALDISWQLIDFNFTVVEDKWHWHSKTLSFDNLPKPNMPLQNASTVLAALEKLEITIDEQKLVSCLSNYQLAGRWQKIHSQPDLFLDVAHNPESVKYLKKQLENTVTGRKKVAVLGMLKDKDIFASLELISPMFDSWFLADINQPRGAQAETLKSVLVDNLKVDAGKIQCFSSITQAKSAAIAESSSDDLVVAFGSFWVVTDLLETISQKEL